MSSVLIGIPCYNGVSPETLDDYMRFAFYLGRYCTDHEFFIGIKPKSEQFRARNAIIEGGLSYDCDYILMLDDDHVIDIDQTIEPTKRFGFLNRLIEHMSCNPHIGIVGALYFQRGADCKPVIMHEKNGGFYYLTMLEIAGGMQRVDVTGGGCMLLRKEIFDKIDSPWFEAESDAGLGTDIQICKKTREAGFEVWCDTSIEIGHVKMEREIISFKSVMQNAVKFDEYMGREDIKRAPLLDQGVSK